MGVLRDGGVPLHGGSEGGSAGACSVAAEMPVVFAFQMAKSGRCRVPQGTALLEIQRSHLSAGPHFVKTHLCSRSFCSRSWAALPVPPFPWIGQKSNIKHLGEPLKVTDESPW